ncbi:MAG: N-acetylmuramoyl-L-alanine amidase [Gordonia sp. (in: high G+C Gram-positive bacteria)]
MTQKRHVRLWPRRLPVAAALAAAMACAVSAGSASAAPAPASPVSATGTALVGKTIFLDPGHQGGADGHDLAKQVSDGRGGKKDCQTTGATSVNGVTEHTINWQIAQLVKAGLESQGARVVLSRANDTGWGGCVDERAAAASRSGAAVAVSLHADSTSYGADNTKKGFHLIVPTLPLPDAKANAAQSVQGRKASEIMRDAFVKAGFPPSNYVGAVNGIQARSDIAAVNLTRIPAVFIEMGNLSNPAEANQLTRHDGQLKYALAVTNGILNYVHPGAAQVTSSPGTAGVTAPSSDDDSGLSIVIPFVQKLLASKDPHEIANLALTEGSDVSAQVLKAMLDVVYGLFGGKLPVG